MPTTAELPRVMAALWRQRYRQRTASMPALAEQFQRELYRHELTQRMNAELYRQTTPTVESSGEHSSGWKNVSGANMFIGVGGRILAGCPGVKGEDVDSLKDESDTSRDEREQRQDVAESRGLEGHEVGAEQAQQLEHQPEGRYPTAEQPATINHHGRSLEVKHDSGWWFWRQAGTQGWVSAGKGGSGSAMWIEQSLRVGQSRVQQPQPQPPPTRKRRRDAGVVRQTLDRTVAEMAPRLGLDPTWLKQAAQDLYAEKTRQMQNREIAKQQIRQSTGLTAATMVRMENAGQDYSSLPGFDVKAIEAARQHPDLDLGNPDDPRANMPAAVWDLIREGRQSVVPAYHPDILNEAADRLERELVAADPDTSFDFGYEEFRRRGRVERYRRMMNQELEVRRWAKVLQL